MNETNERIRRTQYDVRLIVEVKAHGAVEVYLNDVLDENVLRQHRM
jgi:hypothetical protein